MASKKSVLCLHVITVLSYPEKQRHSHYERAPRLILVAYTWNSREADPVILDVSCALHVLLLAGV